MIVIGTTSCRDVLEPMGIVQAFNTVIHVPRLSVVEHLRQVLQVSYFKIKIKDSLGTLRSNDATATRTSLKRVNLRSFSLYSDYSYPLTLSKVGEPS